MNVLTIYIYLSSLVQLKFRESQRATGISCMHTLHVHAYWQQAPSKYSVTHASQTSSFYYCISNIYPYWKLLFPQYAGLSNSAQHPHVALHSPQIPFAHVFLNCWHCDVGNKSAHVVAGAGAGAGGAGFKLPQLKPPPMAKALALSSKEILK